MSSIDNRVVQMEFDNKQFEAGIQTTLKSLEKLQQGLDFKGGTEGIKNIEKAVSGFDISGMGKAIDSIAQHFTWIGRTIDHELDRITSRVIQAAEQMVKSLTIDQVTVGWGKYEEKTRSVATIMNATGKSVDDVNKALQRLNWFTDETSYNFTDMVDNVGKFTSVGVDLDDAIVAMQGIANAAALAGGGVGEASRAMYNFSQAMGTGKLLLQDWKSIELANMATSEFKNALIQSGLAMGTLVKTGNQYVSVTKDGTGAVATFKDANEGFRDSLSAGWITTEVMMDTFKNYGQYADKIYEIVQRDGITAAEAMEQFSDSSMDLGERAFKAAQEARTFTDAINATKDAVSTGWMQSFEIIFGNYEQAKEMWTDLSNTLWDVFAGGAEDRNKLLDAVFQNSKYIGDSMEEWIDSLNNRRTSGRELMIETVANSFQALLKIIDPIKEAFRELFPPMTAKRLYSIIESVRDFSESLIISDESANKLKRGFMGVFSVFKLFADVVKNAFSGIKSLWDATRPFRQEALDIFAKLGDGLTEFYQKFKDSGVFDAIANGVSRTFRNLTVKVIGIKTSISKALDASGILKTLKSKWESIKTWINSKGGISGIVNTFFNVINKWISNINTIKIGESITSFITKIRNSFKDIPSIKDFIEKSFNSIVNFFKNIGGKSTDNLNKGTNSIVKWVKDFIDKIKTGFSDISKKTGGAFESARDAIIKGLGWIVDSFTKGYNFLKTKIGPLMNFIRELFTLKLLSNVTSLIGNLSKIFKSFEGIGKSAESFIDNLSSSISTVSNGLSKSLKGDAILKIAGAIGILVASVFVLTNVVDPTRVYDALTIIGLLFAELAGGLYLFDKALGEGNVKGVKKISGFLSLALGILVLVNVIQKLMGIDTAELGSAMGEIAVILGILAGFTRLSSSDFKATNGAGLLMTAIALQGFVLAMVEIAHMDPENVANGLIGLGFLLTEVSTFSYLGSNITFSNGTGLLMTAIALQGFVLAMVEISNMKPEKAIGGLVGLGVLLTEVGIFTRIASKGIKFSNGAGLIAIALSMVIFAQTIKQIGSLDTDSLIKGLVGLGAALLEISILTKSMSNMSIGSGIGSLLGIASLIVLVPLFKELAKIPDIEKIATSFGIAVIAIGGAIALLQGVGVVGGASAAGAVLAFVGVIALVVTIVEVIAGLLAKLEGTVPFLEGAKEVLGKIGEAIGALFGGMAAGAMTMVAVGLENIGIGLSRFWTNASGFINGVKGLKADSFAALGTLSTAILKLSAGEFLDALTSLIGDGDKNLATFGTQLESLGPSLSKFSGEAKKVDSEAVQNAANALQALTNIEVPSTGGFLQEIIGEKNYGIFGVQLSNLGWGLSQFAKNVGTIENFGAIDSASQAIASLVALDIPTVGGFMDYIVGRTDWGVFGSQLAAFGPNFKTFADSINGIETKGLSNAASSLSDLLAINPPKTDWGLAQIFTGSTDWGKFGTQLTQFGTGFKNFATSMKGVTEDDLAGVTPAISAMKQILELDIPKTDGFFQWLVGQEDLGDFGDNLGKIGTGFGTFNTNVGEVNTYKLTSVVGLIERLGAFANSISPGIIDNISNFGAAMSLIDSSDVSMENAISALSEWEDDFASSGEAFAKAVTNSISTTIKTESLNVSVKDIIDAIANYEDDFKTEGSTLIDNFKTGMQDKKKYVKSKASEIAFNGVLSIRNEYSSYKTSGEYVTEGFAVGMSSRASRVMSVAHALAVAANYAFQSALRISSPSKVMEQNGIYYDEGFIRGVQNGSRNVENASEGLAHSAIGSFQSAMNLIDGVINDSIELQPRIRPVVDLSQVQSSAGSINSIFSQTQTIGLGGYQNPYIPNVLSQISSNMNNGMIGYPQNDNSDIIEAIRDLGNEFETIKDAISQMKIMMNSKALVGQIISDVDSELGKRSRYDGRRH